MNLYPDQLAFVVRSSVLTRMYRVLKLNAIGYLLYFTEFVIHTGKFV